MLSSASMPLSTILIISAFIFTGCAETYHPGSIHDVGFRERAQSKSDEDVRVTVAVLTEEESKELFGVDLASKGIQPVWVKVENHGNRFYVLMWPGMDPNYFSPLEAAYAFHPGRSKSAREDVDDFFQHMKFKNPIVPNASVSGFIFTNLDEGIKVVDVDLVGPKDAKFFTFFVKVPGLRAVHHAVDFEKLYSKDDIVQLNEAGLRAALEQLPCCTTNEDGTESGDPLNFVLIGTLENLSSSFVRRGWLPAEQTHAEAAAKTIKSYLFGTRYRYSPFSPLYLYGRQQDKAAQKPRGTVHQRNHLRLWLSPMRFEGKPVWVGQVSRDIGVRFTAKTWPPVTHKIDPDVDEARISLILDLAYSQQLVKVGLVKGVGAATRSNPRQNLTGDPYFTDGYRAVLVFERRPTSLSGLEYFYWEQGQADRLKRLTRGRQQDFDEQ